MNIFHLSDLHLGKIVNGYSLLEDQQYIINQIGDIITNNEVDVVVIAGDIYDRPIAPAQAISVWDTLITTLANLDVITLIINGNHDSMIRLDYGRDLFATNNIHIVSEEVLYKQIKIKDVNFYLLPFLTLEQASKIADEKLVDYNSLKQYTIKQINLESTQTNIIIDHSYIISGDNDIETDSSIRPLALGGSEFTDSSVYAKFDLVLAGHIHRHSHIKPNIYYSGAIMPYGFGERNNKSGYYIHTISENEITSTYMTFNLLRKFEYIELSIEELNNQPYNPNYVFIKLLDKGQIINPLHKLRPKFPYIMQIMRSFRTLDINEIKEHKQSLTDSFRQFYELNTGEEINAQGIEYWNSIVDQINKGEEDASD